jgi:hypothetical protein
MTMEMYFTLLDDPGEVVLFYCGKSNQYPTGIRYLFWSNFYVDSDSKFRGICFITHPFKLKSSSEYR